VDSVFSTPEKVQLVTSMTQLLHTLWGTLKGDHQAKLMVTLPLCTQMVICLKNLLYFLR